MQFRGSTALQSQLTPMAQGSKGIQHAARKANAGTGSVSGDQAAF